MDRTVNDRFKRIRDLATFVEQEAAAGRWDSALARAVSLNNDAAFITDWLRGQAEAHLVGHASLGEVWEPPAAQPMENITEPLAGTLDPDFAVTR